MVAGVCPGLGMEVARDEKSESFLGSGNTLYDTITVDACHYYTFSKLTEYLTPRVNPKYKLWSTVDCDVSVQVHHL